MHDDDRVIGLQLPGRKVEFDRHLKPLTEAKINLSFSFSLSTRVDWNKGNEDLRSKLNLQQPPSPNTNVFPKAWYSQMEGAPAYFLVTGTDSIQSQTPSSPRYMTWHRGKPMEVVYCIVLHKAVWLISWKGEAVILISLCVLFSYASRICLLTPVSLDCNESRSYKSTCIKSVHLGTLFGIRYHMS